VLRYWSGDLEVLAVLERDSSWPRDDAKTESSARQPAVLPIGQAQTAN
jgi:hypothetical protein